MKYILDKLPGNETIVNSYWKNDDQKKILELLKYSKIVFSYAHEDWPFVEKVAKAIKIFFPERNSFTVNCEEAKLEISNAFCYTEIGNPYEWVKKNNNESDETFIKRNNSKATDCYKQILEQANIFVIFTFKNTIKYGPKGVSGAGNYQKEEFDNWISINKTEEKFQFKIELEKAYNQLDRKFPDWQIPKTVSFSEIESYKIDAFDLSSAQKVAEHIIRKILFKESPLFYMPTSSIFSYEKDIVQFYQEIPSVISDWLNNTKDVQSKENMLKLLAYIKMGVPPFWPSVARQSDFNQITPNLLSVEATNEIGSPRIGIDLLWPTDAPLFKHESKVERQPDMVIAAALSKYHRNHNMLEENLSFPEAGPRSSIYAKSIGKVAIAISGGIAPGINAVIDGIVKRHKKYEPNIKILGINNGLFTLTQWNDAFIEELNPNETSVRVTEGGSYLQTCRLIELLPTSKIQDEKINAIANTLLEEGIKILYVIGGDGSMRASHQIAQACRKLEERAISVVGIPKTMDNDILWVWQTFGFATAVEKAREIIEHLATEVKANPRICVLQLFGSASGFVVSHAVLASPTGTCDFALIPEADFSIDKLAWKLAVKMIDKENHKHRIIPYGLIVMAESAIPIIQDCEKYEKLVGLTEKEHKELERFNIYRKQNPNCFPDGQISNDLRTAGLKLVSEGIRIQMKEIFENKELRKRLENEIKLRPLPDIRVNDEERFRIFTNEPRHLLRSVPPSFSDVIMGSRLGALAVDNAMAGYTDFMISQWLTEFVMVPLNLVALGRKHIPQDGIFWKSVLAKTGQGDLK